MRDRAEGTRVAEQTRMRAGLLVRPSHEVLQLAERRDVLDQTGHGEHRRLGSGGPFDETCPVSRQLAGQERQRLRRIAFGIVREAVEEALHEAHRGGGIVRRPVHLFAHSWRASPAARERTLRLGMAQV